MSDHLLVTPILIPLAAGALILLFGGKRTLEAGAAIGSCVALLINAVALLVMTDASGAAALGRTYALGDWPGAVAIVLAADRLSALMLLLTALLGLAASVFSMGRWSREGPYFLVLSQLLLMGLNGAFLTADLFNLFVFFEVLLAASYGLLLHGSGVVRVKAGLHYIVINLAASLLFLIGVSLIFGVTGTLSMAAVAERLAAAPDETRSLIHAGAAILGVAFLAKAAAWPLGFWLPRTYDAASPPVAAMFAILTKVGVYVILRLSLLLFGESAGVSADFGRTWLFVAGAMTMGVGLIGLLAVRDLGRMGGYNLVVSAGTLLAAVAFNDPAITAGALLYLLISTLAAAALFFLAGVVAGEAGDTFDNEEQLEDYGPAGDGVYTEEDERAVVISAPVGVLSGAFLAITLLVAGMPPLPGFLAKVAMLAPLMGRLDTAAGATMVVLLIASSLCVLIALMRAGVQIWWVEADRTPPAIRLNEIGVLAALVAGLVILTVAVQAPLGFVHRAAAQLHAPANFERAISEAGR